MPAPAVIPALIAYVKVVAVKTLVVGTRSRSAQVELGLRRKMWLGAAGIPSSAK